MKFFTIYIYLLLILHTACNSTIPKTKSMIHQPKSYSCDVETGVCDTINRSEIEEIQIDQLQKVTLVYYTDPICSACWAIEPALKKFKLEYGKYLQIEYKMNQFF